MRLRRMPAATKTAPPRRARRGSGGSGGSERLDSSKLAGLSDLPDLPDLPDPPSVSVILGRRLTERAAGALHQVALDEHVDVAVENAVDVADLLLRPVILHHLVRMQDVAADLAAEADLLLDAADLRQLRLVLLHLDVVKARLQHAHRRVAVAVLRPLVLARHNQ